MFRVKTISGAHEFLGLKKPEHPLISVYSHDNLKQNEEFIGVPFALDLYQIVFKMCSPGFISYGRNSYDFQEGSMLFVRPGQVLAMQKWKENDAIGGWSLIFHPDLIRKSKLGSNIDNYSFFSYDVHEALHLSEDEKNTLLEITEKIKKEYTQNIDAHSHELIISNLELLLNYCTRFYDRQFFTRTNLNKDIISKFNTLLKEYYNSAKQLELGVPTVKFCGSELNMSSHYLSDMLRKETGRSAQEHIIHFLIERAKTQLLSSEESVSQIAYGLGYEYPQHFSKIFKAKTGMSPAEYRNLN